MTTLSVSPSFPVFTDRDGSPLENGYIWIGTAALAPITNPISVYWDAARTQLAAQPIRTLNGYPSNNGTPARLYVGSDYSMLVQDAKGTLVYSSPNATERWSDVVVTGADASEVNFLAAGTGAQVRTAQSKMRERISVLDFGADPTGATDTSAAIQNAINAANGATVYFPTGTYRIDSTIDWVTSASSVFTTGLKILGDGPDKTIIDTRVANGTAINVDTDALVEFQLFVSIESLTITSLASPASARGITLRKAYMATLRDVWVKNLTGDGVQITMNAGDSDGSNMIEMNQCRIENCAGWGIDVDVTGPYNETSFMRLQHVFIQACGTASVASPPPSGGFRWKGQVLTMDQSAIVICENVGLYIQGGSGLSNTVFLENMVFENNKARSIYCSGVDGFVWVGGNIYNNDSYTATIGAEFDGASYVVRGVDIRNIIVRATAANNALEMFKISGANALLNTCRVRNTIWQNFDHAGQSRLVGWQFDQVENTCELVVLDATTLRYRPVGTGNKTPFRLRGINAGSTTGEWISLELATNGVSITNAGLANSTRYYVYLYDNANVPTLEISTTVTAVDSASGYTIKSGDATRFYVGSVLTDGSAQFLTSATGWLNPSKVSGSQVGVPAYLWVDSTGDLRIKTSLPTSDTDGTIVGTQS